MVEGDESIYFKQQEKFESMQEEPVDYVNYLQDGWNSSVRKTASENMS